MMLLVHTTAFTTLPECAIMPLLCQPRVRPKIAVLSYLYGAGE